MKRPTHLNIKEPTVGKLIHFVAEPKQLSPFQSNKQIARYCLHRGREPNSNQVHLTIILHLGSAYVFLVSNLGVATSVIRMMKTPRSIMVDNSRGCVGKSACLGPVIPW